MNGVSRGNKIKFDQHWLVEVNMERLTKVLGLDGT